MVFAVVGILLFLNQLHLCSSAQAVVDPHASPTQAGGFASGVMSFDDFIAHHGRGYKQGTPEYDTRRAIYDQHASEISLHNSQSERLWTATVNTFSDQSKKERSKLLGWKRAGSRPAEGPELLQTAPIAGTTPETVDWRHLQVASSIPNQGGCGSCWAVTTASVLTAHHEIYRNSVKHFSAQELVNCVDNPRHCGGSGGCDGATVELGMAYIKTNGLSDEDTTPYAGEDGQCATNLAQVVQQRSSPADVSLGGAAFGFMGHNTLAKNQETPLVRALIDKGPVAVSVAADSWFSYSSGIFNNCDSFVVDHAVTLYGYGKDGNHRYWHIRNSWGQDWGENGFIRLERKNNEEGHCGTDDDTKKGVACDDDPDTDTVCGTCGVLYDSVIPHFNGTRSLLLVEQSRISHQSKSLAEVKTASVGSDAMARLIRKEPATQA